MRAVVVSPDHSLAIAEVPDPVAGPAEVLIDVAATAVNRADLHQRRGNYSPPPGASEILGLEVAGTIAALGDGVNGWKVGDRVGALLAGGGYAQRVAAPAGQLLPLGSLGFDDGAAQVEALATAWLNLFHEGELRRGEHVLIHAGASSVGAAAIQVARHLGAIPWVTVGSSEKLDHCIGLGAAGGLDHHPNDLAAFTDTTKRWTDGAGFDVILCCVGATYFELNLRSLAVDGRLVLIGLLGGREAALDLGRLLVKRQRIVGNLLRSRSVAEKSWLLGELGLRLWPRVLAGENPRPRPRDLPAGRRRGRARARRIQRHEGKSGASGRLNPRESHRCARPRRADARVETAIRAHVAGAVVALPDFSLRQLPVQCVALHKFSTRREVPVGLDIRNERGAPLDRQKFTWREMAGVPYSKLDDDAFTRVRVILMNGIEAEALRFSHALRSDEPGAAHAPREGPARRAAPADDGELAQPRRSVAARDDDRLRAGRHRGDGQRRAERARSVPRAGLSLRPARGLRPPLPLLRADGPRRGQGREQHPPELHGHPAGPTDRASSTARPRTTSVARTTAATAHPLTKLNALTIVAGEQQTHDYYMTIGPLFADPVARKLYAEIASIEEQHVTQYESIQRPRRDDGSRSGCSTRRPRSTTTGAAARPRTNPRIKAIWERFLDYELGHLQFVKELVQSIENRDPDELLPAELPDPISYESQRDFVREVLENEVDLRASGPDYVPLDEDPERSKEYRAQLASQGSPSEIVAEGYRWRPGGEMVDRASALADASLGGAK